MNKINFWASAMHNAPVETGAAAVTPDPVVAAGQTPPPVDPAAASPQTLLGGADDAASADSGSQAPAANPALDALTDETFATALPEGLDLADEGKTALLEAINSGTSRAEIAKNLLTLYQGEITKFQAAQTAVWDQTQTAWQDEIRADPAFAGDKLATSLTSAKEMALQLGGQEFLNMLDITGAGNNVHVLRALLKAKELIPQEAKPVSGNPAAQPKSLAERLFANP